MRWTGQPPQTGGQFAPLRAILGEVKDRMENL
jgi:hypothetical protein